MGKKILGLDLGVTSIGWALIEEDADKNTILGMGSRIIPLSTDDKDEFSSGNKISKNQKRTTKRTQRKGYDRYQLRRKYLTQELIRNNLFDNSLFSLGPLELWGLRAKSVTQRVELKELGRVLYHLNQKRGYKSSRSDANLDKKDPQYVATVKSRHQEIKEKGITIGQKFFFELSNDQYYRTKDQVFPREAYIEEFDAILKEQSRHYPSILSNKLIDKLKNEIIYYQRPLKSQKSLVNVCDLAGFLTKSKDGKEIYAGPKVAPKSSPLFQLCKIWETVNNITLKVKNSEGAKYKWSDKILSIKEKESLVSYLTENEHLSFSELLNILNLKKEEVYANKQILKGLQGNLTVSALNKLVESEYLKFDIKIVESHHQATIIDKKTGEVLVEEDSIKICSTIEQEPLYKLWHTIYSIKDVEECKRALLKNFDLEDSQAERLAKIDFTKYAFGNKSTKAMRLILPYLMKGYMYSEASSLAGYNHSNSLTKTENEQRILLDKLQLLPKNSLRQPIVEKILNQAINVTNAIIDAHGKPVEIRVELARELKQSKDERNESDLRNKANEKLNLEISSRLKSLGVSTTKKYIQKYKFIFPTLSKNLKEAIVENTCIYCGKSFSISEALTGDNFDVDHIVPKSLLFDDSQTNKVLVHRSCNAQKTNQTAYDFIAKKGEVELEAYVKRVDDWFKRGIISYTKMNRLKVSFEEYIERKRVKKETEADKRLWENFIDRQLRETQYIARKAKEVFSKICYNVTTTEGTVTAKLRELWGWDDVLMNLQLPKYRELGLTQFKEWTSDHGRRTHKKEEITGWSKRDDHRHHAIDALVIAFTKQGYIQRINTLHSSDVKDAMNKEIKEAGIEYDERRNLLEQYLIKERPLSTSEVEAKVAEVLVSFKAGKKVATKGVRKISTNGKKEIIQKNIVTPRGALSEESVYGKIKTIEKNKPLKYLFENPQLIFNEEIKKLVLERLQIFDNDAKKAFSSTKDNPIYTDKRRSKILQSNACFKEDYVIKYPIQSIKLKDINYIIDEGIKEIIKIRLSEFNNNEKEAFKDTLWLNKEKNIPIKSVKMFTGLSAVEPVARDSSGQEIGFVKPGNNHHIAFYLDESGAKIEHACTFWHAVERKKFGLPVIINNPKEIWDKILDSGSYPENFLQKLPRDKYSFVESMEQNEMFVLGLSTEEFENAVLSNDKIFISKHLYIVWSISEGNYWFRHHLETKNTELKKIETAKQSRRYYNIRSIKGFNELNPIKVRINHIGNIKTITH